MKKFIKDFADQLFDQQIDGLTSDTVFRDLEEWDSLTAMAVIAMIQDNYNVKIDTDEFKRQTTIGDLYNFTQQNK